MLDSFRDMGNITPFKTLGTDTQFFVGALSLFYRTHQRLDVQSPVALHETLTHRLLFQSRDWRH
jgi:hypothetical protein